MNKFIFTLLVTLSSFSFSAESISTTDVGSITSIFSYDDYLGGALYIQFSSPLSICPSGGYLKPGTGGFLSMQALALSSMMADKRVILQLYTDRVLSNRCEIDAVRVYK